MNARGVILRRGIERREPLREAFLADAQRGACLMTTLFAASDCTASRIAAPRRIVRVLKGALTRLAEWRERCEQRKHLAGMNERMLKDIGISRADAAREANKPFWRA